MQSFKTYYHKQLLAKQVPNKDQVTSGLSAIWAKKNWQDTWAIGIPNTNKIYFCWKLQKIWPILVKIAAYLCCSDSIFWLP